MIFSQFLSTTVKTFLFRSLLGTRHHLHAFQRFFAEFLKWKIWSFKLFYNSYNDFLVITIHIVLIRMEILVKREKKYFVLDCLKIFLLDFISLNNEREVQNLSDFSRANKNIFIITALLHLDRLILKHIGVFWSISNVHLCCKSVADNIIY